jgi:hypothetical protein
MKLEWNEQKIFFFALRFPGSDQVQHVTKYNEFCIKNYSGENYNSCFLYIDSLQFHIVYMLLVREDGGPGRVAECGGITHSMEDSIV